jgi:hypothetical protein
MNEVKGDLRVWVHLDKIVFHVIQAERLDSVSSGQRQTKGDYRSRVHLDKMVLVVVRQGGWTVWAVAKETQGKADKRLWQPRRQLNRQTDSPTGKDNLLFF